MAKTQRDISRVLKFSLNQDFGVIFKLNRKAGGFQLVRKVANSKLRDLFYKLALLKYEVPFLNGDHVESLANFCFQFFTDIIILPSEVKPSTRVPDIKHSLIVKDKRTDQVKVLLATDSDMDIRVSFRSQYVAVVFFCLIKISF